MRNKSLERMYVKEEKYLAEPKCKWRSIYIRLTSLSPTAFTPIACKQAHGAVVLRKTQSNRFIQSKWRISN